MYIYKITCLINNKIYIGKTEKSLEIRFNNHIKKAYINKSKMLISKAILKYGSENFKIDLIEECHDKSHLSEREIYWIKKLKSTDKSIGYNSTCGGTGGDTYTNNSRYNEICNKHRILILNETRESRMNRTKKLKGQKRSKITRDKISKSRKGMIFTDVHKKNISVKTKEAMKNIEVYNIRPVDCYDLNGNFFKKFKSLAEASRELNIGKMSIFKNCNNKRNKAGKYIFKYSQ